MAQQRGQALDAENFYRTNDMAMATYLKMQGHPVQTLMWEGDVCYWVFRVTDALLEETEVFLADEARVNPKLFNKEFFITKSQFYDSKDERRRY